MKKDAIRAAIVAAVVLALYNLIVFVIPFDRSDAFWVSYVFTMVAFIVVGIAVYLAFMRNPDAKSRFYGFPIARVGVIYGVCQVVASFLFMAIGDLLVWWVPMLLYAIGLGIAIIGLVTTETVVDRIQQQDEKLKVNTSVMRSIQGRVNHLALQTGDPAVRALAEELRYSDPVSSPAIAQAEGNLIATVYAMENAFANGNMENMQAQCRNATIMLAERNRLCKMYKG